MLGRGMGEGFGHLDDFQTEGSVQLELALVVIAVRVELFDVSPRSFHLIQSLLHPIQPRPIVDRHCEVTQRRFLHFLWVDADRLPHRREKLLLWAELAGK